jgi:hypothetical protein
MFWNEYHFGDYGSHDDHDDYNDWFDYDDYNCEWKYFYPRCSDFDFNQEDYDYSGYDCDITLAFNPCVTDHFECEYDDIMDDYSESQDCTEDFLDAETWSEMREDSFWYRPENEELMQFHQFWDMYHSNSDYNDYHDWTGEHDDYNDWYDYDDYSCEWKEFNFKCSDFDQEDHDYDYYPVEDYEFSGEYDYDYDMEYDCDIYLSYNPCVTDYFECEYFENGEFEDVHDCQDEFTEAEAWMELREDSFWYRPENAELMEFHAFWDMYHYNSDYNGDASDEFDDYNNDYENCEWKEWSGDCAMWEFSQEDECQWYISYSPCVDDMFICELNEFNEYGEPVMRDCQEDFADVEFWTMMSGEAAWQMPENQMYYDFYMFWNEYHFGDHHDDYGNDCRDKQLIANCDEFKFLEIENGDCYVDVAYNTCVDDGFYCMVHQLGEEDYDCAEDFEDPMFWSQMREEDFWFESVNEEYWDFYSFWQDFHFGHDDYSDYDDYWQPDCEWKELNAHCDDFNSLEGCGNIHVEYNPCVDDHFVCEVMIPVEDYDMTAIAEVRSCVDDFLDIEFWNGLRTEEFWEENQQYADFYMFWEMYHMDHHDDDYGHGDYNDYDRDCEMVQVEATCADFEFIDDDCVILAEYNRCPEREHFWCDLIKNDIYGNEYLENCSEDFADAQFWAMMREEQFWTDNMDKYWDFYGFWEEFHTADRNGDYDDYGCVQCVEYDCAADTGIEECKMTQCYDACSMSEDCHAAW